MRRRFLLWTPVLVLVILPFTGCLTLDSSVVYFPSRYPEGDWKPGEKEFEDVWFEAADGTRLHGWFAEAKNPRAVVLHTHGNAGNITHRADRLRQFRDQLRVSMSLFD